MKVAVYKRGLTALILLLAGGLACLASAPPPPWSVGWRLKVGAPVSRVPAVCQGVIYAVSDRGEIMALGLDGMKRWATALPRSPQPELFSTPPLCVGPFVCAGTDKGQLYAFDAGTGALRWKTKIGEDLYGALTWLEPEGTVTGRTVLALSRNNGSLVRVDLNTGRILWSSPPCGRSDGSPAVGNGFIVFGACDAALHLIAPSSGTVLGSMDFTELGPMAGGVAVAGPRVYAGTRNGSLLCADATSFTLLWTNRVAGSEIFTTPALTSNQVLAGSSDGLLYCLNRTDGAKLWSVPTEGTPASPVVAGHTVVVTSGGTLSVLDLAGGQIVWQDKPCDSLSPPAVAGGKIIVGTDDGFMILYQPK